MTSGNLAAWKLKEGDSFSAGDVLAEVETGKVPQSIIDAISYVRRHDNNDVWGYSTSGTAACAPRRPVNLT